MTELFPMIAALCAGIAVTCAAILLTGFLQEVRIDREAAKLDSVRKLPVYFRLLMIFSPNVEKIAAGKSFESSIKRIQSQISMAGLERTLTASQFLSIRILSAVFGFLLAILVSLRGNAMMGLLLFALLAVYPGTWLRSAVTKRHTEILKGLPNLLDLLTLSVEAGKDFLTALRDILVKRKPDALTDEFSRTLQEIQLGKKRQTALKEMSKRIQQPELSSVLNSIVQADEMGVSIGQILRIQSDQMRAKRFAMAEKLANEAPVKILFPVVVFIFPAVFLMLMGPVLLRMLKLVG